MPKRGLLSRAELLSKPIENFDAEKVNTTNVVKAFGGMRGVAGDVANATRIYQGMLKASQEIR